MGEFIHFLFRWISRALPCLMVNLVLLGSLGMVLCELGMQLLPQVLLLDGIPHGSCSPCWWWWCSVRKVTLSRIEGNMNYSEKLLNSFFPWSVSTPQDSEVVITGVRQVKPAWLYGGTKDINGRGLRWSAQCNKPQKFIEGLVTHDNLMLFHQYEKCIFKLKPRNVCLVEVPPEKAFSYSHGRRTSLNPSPKGISVVGWAGLEDRTWQPVCAQALLKPRALRLFHQFTDLESCF